MRSRPVWFLLVFLFGALQAGFAFAADAPVMIVIENHKFTPAEVRVPAGKRVELSIENRDGTPEEFESLLLKREKIIPPGGKASIWIGPLPKGTYEFVGEFHEDTAKGKIIAE